MMHFDATGACGLQHASGREGGKGGGTGEGGGRGRGRGGRGVDLVSTTPSSLRYSLNGTGSSSKAEGQLGRRRRRVPPAIQAAEERKPRVAAAGAECGCLLRGARMWPPDSGSLLRLNSSNLPPDAKELRSRIE